MCIIRSKDGVTYKVDEGVAKITTKFIVDLKKVSKTEKEDLIEDNDTSLFV